MLFDDQTTSIYEQITTSGPTYMRTDIQEKEGNYLLEIELPGFLHEDIKAELTNGILTIIANRPEHLENEVNKSNFIRRERIVGSCKRSFYVGEKVRQEDITAAFTDGVLSIIIKNTERMVDHDDIKLIPIS